MEGQLRSNLAAMDDLDKISRRDNVAIFRLQLEKSVNGPPRVANCYGVCLSARLPKADQEGNH
jgi:hypothetical protein